MEQEKPLGPRTRIKDHASQPGQDEMLRTHSAEVRVMLDEWHSGRERLAQRIAAPMVGGVITAPFLSMFVVPVVYLLLRRRRLGMQSAITIKI